jgi:hypothetical protein
MNNPLLLEQYLLKKLDEGVGVEGERMNCG